MEEPRRGLTTPEQLEAMKKELEKASDPKRLARLRKKRILKNIGGFVLALLIILLVSVTAQIMIAKSTGRVRSLFGFYLYSLRTDAMSPSLPRGSVILSRSPEYLPPLGPGAVVTFYDSEGGISTLRISEASGYSDEKRTYRVNADNPETGSVSETLSPDRIEAVLIIKIPLVSP